MALAAASSSLLLAPPPLRVPVFVSDGASFVGRHVLQALREASES